MVGGSTACKHAQCLGVNIPKPHGHPMAVSLPDRAACFSGEGLFAMVDAPELSGVVGTGLWTYDPCEEKDGYQRDEIAVVEKRGLFSGRWSASKLYVWGKKHNYTSARFTEPLSLWP